MRISSWLANGLLVMVFLLCSCKPQVPYKYIQPDKMEDIPKDLPILITAGKEDPVGNYGEGPEKLYNIYKNDLQIKNVDIKLYDGFRHELQQEIGREQVFADQYEWIKKVVDSAAGN